jgi:hypothetical protein
MGLLVTLFAMLNCRIAVFSRFARVFFGFIVVAGFMVRSGRVMVLGGLMMPIGSVHMMLGSWMFYGHS